MKKDDKETSDGLTQIIEIINAKGDTGEIEEILQNAEQQKEDE